MNGVTRSWRLLTALIAVMALVAAACGGGSDGEDASAPDGEATTTTERVIDTTEAGSGGGEEEPEEAVDVAPPSGTLRYAEFSAVTTFDPAGSQTAQSAYLYPVYDTLTLQAADFSVQPNLATAWSSPEPTVWEFTLRDDVVFHDGEAFNAQVAADNMERSKAFAGNPNAAVWTGMVSATAVDDVTLRVEFAAPQPQFPIQMSMVMGMMVSPGAFESDNTRAPAGSGPWIWQDGDSQAGVTEIYTLNEAYWNPAHQGVERVEISAVPDNAARVNAGITGEADIVATVRDADVSAAVDGGLEVVGVPNYFPYIVITSRDGNNGEELADERVRQAIAYSIDREAYSEAIQLNNGDSKGGIFPSAFADWHVDELDDSFAYDPDKARELLTEAGYPDGITITMPVMPAITPPMDLIVQMLGASGITVEQAQINNGELGPRVTNRDNREFGIAWLRDLLYHPANDLPKFVDPTGRINPGGLTDAEDLSAMLAEAAEAPDLETAKAIYADVSQQIIERGIVIPLAHGAQNGAFDPTKLSGVVMALNMQAPMPYGVRFIS